MDLSFELMECALRYNLGKHQSHLLLLILTVRLRPTEVEQSILEDLRNRVQLSNVALPSVSFYTFINTHNR